MVSIAELVLVAAEAAPAPPVSAPDAWFHALLPNGIILTAVFYLGRTIINRVFDPEKGIATSFIRRHLEFVTSVEKKMDESNRLLRKVIERQVIESRDLHELLILNTCPNHEACTLRQKLLNKPLGASDTDVKSAPDFAPS